MKVCENVYQIRIDFNVTPEIKRYVYVYLITGEYCYLIDAGVAGCESIIDNYMQKLDRKISEIKAIFLTHAHPDHIGGAAEIKRITGCKIYASEIEKAWIEDINLQFRERPIPNFYSLVNKSVKVEQIVKENDEFIIEPGIMIRVIETSGHSMGAMSYIYENERIIFCGDAIPVSGDFPIFVDEESSELSLRKIKELKNIDYCCPAWDKVYEKKEIQEIIDEGDGILKNLKKYVRQVCIYKEKLTEEDVSKISVNMGLENMAGNPLFRKSIEACAESIVSKLYI